MRKIQYILLNLILITSFLQANELFWGKISNYKLQMACDINDTDNIAICYLRNGDSNTIKINDYFLGYFETVKLYYLEQDTWIELPRLPVKMRILKSAGSSKKDNIILKPKQIYTNTKYMYSLGYPTKIIEKYYSKYNKNASFILDLSDFDWPIMILSKRYVEIKIVQKLLIDHIDYYLYETESLPLKLNTQNLLFLIKERNKK